MTQGKNQHEKVVIAFYMKMKLNILSLHFHSAVKVAQHLMNRLKKINIIVQKK